jgi:hypothetical protein
LFSWLLDGQPSSHLIFDLPIFLVNHKKIFDEKFAIDLWFTQGKRAEYRLSNSKTFPFSPIMDNDKVKFVGIVL